MPNAGEIVFFSLKENTLLMCHKENAEGLYVYCKTPQTNALQPTGNLRFPCNLQKYKLL
jgi:hypothetical protein